MNPEQRQKLLLVLAIGMACILLGDRFVISPLLNAWKSRGARIVELRKQVAQGSLLVERDGIIRERWASMRTNTLPAEVSTGESRVLKAFDTWSSDSRVSITSIKPQWRRPTDDYATLECRVDASGSIATIAHFLHAIEKDPLALKIEMVELTSRDNDGRQLTLNLQVSGLQFSPELQR